MTRQTKKNMVSALLGLGLASSTLLTLSSFTMLAFAQPTGGGGRGGPPPEAYEACVDLSEGDACSVEGRNGETLEGQCGMPPRGEQKMLCLPEGGPPERNRPG